MASNGSKLPSLVDNLTISLKGLSMARTVTELQDAISNLEQILDAGATMVTIDGETTQFDLEGASIRVRDLKAELATLQGKANRRPLFNQIDLS
jgi:hypothetical protein